MNRLLKDFLMQLRKGAMIFESRFDKEFLTPDAPLSQAISHQKWRSYLYEIGNKPGTKVLEVGSREVTSPSEAREKFSKAEYVGFDYYDGNNGDVVGDAHRLSSYFDEQERFDVVYSSACF